jgi:hypothetical protein
MTNKKHEDTAFRIPVSTLEVKFVAKWLKLSNLFFHLQPLTLCPMPCTLLPLRRIPDRRRIGPLLVNRFSILGNLDIEA